MLASPLNDKQCLSLLFEEVRRLTQRRSVRDWARQFQSIDKVVAYIRNLEQRDDLGDQKDGPRLPCEISQRARFAPSDPNCFERVLLFLVAAEILDPNTARSAASLVLNEGWHTFPVELTTKLPRVVVLDPITPPRNVMTATAHRTRNVIPGTEKNIAPWFLTLARNACMDHDPDSGEARCQQAITSLRQALLTGEPLDHPEELEHLLNVSYHDAQLWGMRGMAAYDRVTRSIRNLSIHLDGNRVNRFLQQVLKTGSAMAPQALRAALIAKYGPAAAVAFEGVQLALADESTTAGEAAHAGQKVGTLQLALEGSTTKPNSKPDEKVGTLQLALEGNRPPLSPENARKARKHRVRHMTLAFREP